MSDVLGRFVVKVMPGSGFVRAITLLAAGLVLLLPGTTQLPVIDRDEARFAQASRQMHQSGDWIIPMIQDRPRLNKPPLVYWLHCLSIKMTDLPDQVFAYRFISVSAALLCGFFTMRLGSALFDRRVGYLSSLGLLASPLIAFDARQARADQLLMLATVAASYFGWRLWQSSATRPVSRWESVPFALCISFGAMAKGPVLPALVLLAAAAHVIHSRSLRRLFDIHPFTILCIGAIPILGWAFLVIDRLGMSPVVRFVEHEMLGRMGSAVEGHGGVPGTHFLLLPALLWPLSFVLWETLIHWRREQSPSQMWLWGWIIPGWVLFELAGTKLPHYTMPLYPLIAILLAARVPTWSPVHDWRRGLVVILWCIAGMGFPIAAWWIRGHAVWTDQFDQYSVSSSTLFCLTLALSILFLALAGKLLWMGRGLLALLSSALVSLFSSWALFGQSLPSHRAPWLTEAVVARLESETGRSPASPDGPELAAVGYAEDSLVFATCGRVVLSPSEPMKWLREDSNRWLVDDGSLGPLDEDLAEVCTIDGYRYPKGISVELRLIRSKRVNP